LTNLKRYQVFLADRAKQDLRDIHDYILVNFYSQQAADGKVDFYMPIENYLAFYYMEKHRVYVARIFSAKQDWVKIFYK